MKLNSKKVLLYLYPLAGESRRASYDQLKLFLLDLTEAGRQSLIRLLVEKQLIFSDELTGEQRLTISSHGQAQLELDFPSLKVDPDREQGQWSMLLFLSAPKIDKNFRYLRTLVLNNRCLALKRGVYLYPGKLPNAIQQTLQKTYRSAVIVVQFDQWQFGDENIIIGQKANFKDTISIYSGIGEELESLLTKLPNYKSLSNQQKQQINSIYDRLISALENDIGLLPNYFPQAPDGVELLNQFKQGVDLTFNF